MKAEAFFDHGYMLLWIPPKPSMLQFMMLQRKKCNEDAGAMRGDKVQVSKQKAPAAMLAAGAGKYRKPAEMKP